jgi:hypothetical protein
VTVANPDGNIEIHPGPRGHSIVSLYTTPDGKQFGATTDEPRRTNPIPLLEGPPGQKGDTGNPGRSAVRVESAENEGTAGYRVFQWDPTLMAEQLVYGDTGVLDLGDGRTVRRVMSTVELEGSIDGLPEGFRPAMPQPGTVHKVYTTADPWPENITGWTQVAPPTRLQGLEGYDADRASGYPGTPEQWINDIYRVVLPPAGTPGQVLTRTAAGSAWSPPKDYGPGPWQGITLNDWTPSNNSGAFARLSNGSVELYGLLGYRGATTTVGGFTGSFLRIGVLPPALAPQHGVDHPITTYRASDNQPVQARLIISTQGVMSLGAFASAKDTSEFTVKANVTAVNISSTSFALRNSGPSA